MLLAGRYRLDTEIGRGGMGEVWRAYDQMLARAVAVKLLLPQDTDATAASRFRLEAQTAGRLNHPNLVGVLDFGEHDNRLFLVMELVDGDSLSGVLAVSGALTAERVAALAAQAAAGLAAAHEQGIVHRDVKPANLLLDAHGTLKIGDFGIARFLDDPGAALTATGQIVGTGLYLAPERALGKPASPASDMYSLGCVLYQLLSGRPPFQADTAVALLHQHLDNAPVPPRELGVTGLPPAFESYLLALLAKQPEDRPTAQQTAEWFAGGAWRGLPEPLPQAAFPAAPSGPGAYAAAETGGPATYTLPTGSRTAREGRSRRAAPRNARGSRPRVAATAAAAALFLAAMLAGMMWFSPDDTATEGTEPDASPSASSPAASSSAESADPLVSAPAADGAPTVGTVADVTPSTTAPAPPTPADPAPSPTTPTEEATDTKPEKADKPQEEKPEPPREGPGGDDDEGDG
ncbi:serine/threonine protein kinase [Streptomyces viridochromogenes DSM 40736]|uniref:non-specific serine/threonine protein kinase n=1 Tax=Streptomyces viridochromogenes (strain DSM 40736 / JCM 4977 / BCRC 1201 / Tue 494) TaxID=591159 RepID=D9XBT4_STRVT|nr:serine/threonine-protein kinase [Streptomyces viridochromogenes]EFL36637.1 serine/threonine protein kinase [Streptomyces viridochromogenes DSM 40736]